MQNLLSFQMERQILCHTVLIYFGPLEMVKTTNSFPGKSPTAIRLEVSMKLTPYPGHRLSSHNQLEGHGTVAGPLPWESRDQSSKIDSAAKWWCWASHLTFLSSSFLSSHRSDLD